jgi:hypothetical protein
VVTNLRQPTFEKDSMGVAPWQKLGRNCTVGLENTDSLFQALQTGRDWSHAHDKISGQWGLRFARRPLEKQEIERRFGCAAGDQQPAVLWRRLAIGI